MVITVIAGMLICLLPEPPSRFVVMPNRMFPVEKPADASLADISNDELIKRLPRCREEYERSEYASDWTYNKFASEFHRRLEQRLVTYDELRTALTHVQMIRSSPKWFPDAEYRVWFRLPTWLEGVECVATANVDEAKQIRAYHIGGGGCGNGLMWQEEEESYQSVGKLCHWANEVVFHLSLKHFDWEGGNVIWTGDMTLPVQLVERANYEPVDNPELKTLCESFAAFEVEWPKSDSAVPIVCLDPDLRQYWTTLPADVVIEREVTLLKRDKEVIKRVFVDPRELPTTQAVNQSISVACTDEPISMEDVHLYSVRVRGVEPSNQSRWCRTKYWAGEYTVPLRKNRLTDEEVSRLP